MVSINRKPISYYPVFLNVCGRKCVVIGGGQVALRKVRALLDCGANIEVISPLLCSELVRLAHTGEILVCKRNYKAGDLSGAFLVIAATDRSGVNIEAAKEARKKDILINVVDSPEYSDFIVPSSLRRGDINLSISTAGKSPALARKIRERLEKDLGNEYAVLASLVSEVRTELKDRGVKVDAKQWQKALNLDSLTDLLRKNKIAQARESLFQDLGIRQR